MPQASCSAPAPASASAREIWSWACFDFANSGYTTVVMTTIYSAYFVAVIAGAADLAEGVGTLLWTLAVALANLVVLVTGPVLGALADRRACKKRLLLGTTVGCVLATAALGLVGPGQVLPAMSLVVLSAIAFASGENLIAAFLPEIAPPARLGRISGYGWSLGYAGGLLTLGCCLAYISWAAAHGQPAEHYVPVTLLITAAIFAVAATPTFLWLRERARPVAEPGGAHYLWGALRRVVDTLRHASRLPDLFRFLCCLTLYQAGVATVVVIAAIYAQEVMGFDSQQLIVLVMVVNFTAALGAFGFGHAQDRFGSVRSLAAGLGVWLVAIAAAWFADRAAHIWLAGNLIGLAMGATQAGGRALIARLTPVSRSGEIFGLWGVANRAAAIIGPLAYGAISGLSGGDHRLAMLSTGGFFLAGLILLATVDESRGRATALVAR